MFALSGVHKRIVGFVLLFGLTVLLGATLLMPSQANAQTAPSLGTAVTFAVLGSTTVTNTGASVVNGDLGVSPGTAVTGFPPGSVTPPGTIHAADAVALQAQNDATAAYLTLASEPCTQNLTGQDLGGMTLTTGVYCFDTSAQLTGTLTLDAGGNAGAVFVFKMGSTLTTAGASSVLVTNGGVDCNVWWQVGSSATLGTTTAFAGNILALTSIALTTGANVSGRVLAQTGAVTMDTNIIGSTACVPPPRPALSLTKDDGGVTVAPRDTIRYTLTFQNTGNVLLDNVILTETVLADTTFNVGASTPGWNCGVSPCTFNLGALAPGASGSAIFALRVNDSAGTMLLTNTATITSGATSATGTDTTSVIEQPPGAVPTNVPPPGATAVPPLVFTAVPGVSVTQSAGGAGSSSSGARTVGGLPNTGGGPPQPTYWVREPRP